MGIRESYAEGVFNWVDLATIDIEAAKQFYQQLFQWHFQDMPVEGPDPYSMAFKNDRSVAAVFRMPDQMKAQHIPPHWQSYISVLDMEGAVQKWQSHGGTVLTPPFEVMDAGWMAVVQDPVGATLNLWQARNHVGAGLVNEVNTFCWTELQTRDPETAKQFYQAVFAWEVEVEDKPPYYITCKVKNHYNCGIFDMRQVDLPPEIPSNWVIYFNTQNLEDSIRLAKSLGANLLMEEPMTIEAGRFTTITDPQGAVLVLIELTIVDD
jgi:hypothetical protein